MRRKKAWIVLLPLILQASFVSCQQAKSVSISYSQNEEPVKFSIEEIKASLKENGYRYTEQGGDYRILFNPINSSLGREAYSLKKDSNGFVITGGDTNGLMYGGLQLAEAIHVETDLDRIQDKEEGKSYLEKRGLNVRPALDMRTPGYTDQADCVRLNEADSWNLDYCTEPY